MDHLGLTGALGKVGWSVRFQRSSVFRFPYLNYLCALCLSDFEGIVLLCQLALRCFANQEFVIFQ